MWTNGAKTREMINHAITNNSIVYLLDHVCFDIDEKLDFEIMEYLISSNKLDFDL